MKKIAVIFCAIVFSIVAMVGCELLVGLKLRGSLLFLFGQINGQLTSDECHEREKDRTKNNCNFFHKYYLLCFYVFIAFQALRVNYSTPCVTNALQKTESGRIIRRFL